MSEHNGVTRTKWPACTGLVIATFLLTRELPTTYAADKPVHTAIATLAICGATVLVAGRFVPRESPTSNKRGYNLVSLGEIGHAHHSRDPSPVPTSRRGTYDSEEEEDQPSPRKWRLLFLTLVLLLCLRSEVWHRILKNVQCSRSTLAPTVPVLLAAWEWWRAHRSRKIRQRKATRVSSDDDVDASAYEVLVRLLAESAAARLAVVSLVGFGGLLAVKSTASPHGSYICIEGLPTALGVSFLQTVGTILDAIIAICIARLLSSGGRSLSSRFATIGWALLFSAILLLSVGVVYFLAEEADRTWILTMPQHYVWPVIRLNFYIVFAFLAALVVTLHMSLVTTSLIVTFTSVLTTTTASAWADVHPFPPSPLSLAFLGIFFALLGFFTYLQFETISSATSTRRQALFTSRIPAWLYAILIIIFLTWTGIKLNHNISVSYHPIDLLIYEAEAAHDHYSNQAHASKNLKRAVFFYHQRYGRSPPPGFSDWYAYATARSSAIIDDFDSIHRDLLPFYSLTPQEIRHRTWELIANPWNFASGISVRSGKAAILPNVQMTHAWMLEGVMEMISKFSQHLPDMDLAFNLNDESRVAVPYDEIKRMRGVGQQFKTAPDPVSQFSSGRAAQWNEIPTDPPLDTTPLVEHSWQQTFHRYSAPTCPSSSAARVSRIWDTSTHCVTCSAPHSLGAFVSNWTLSADVCHQPDLANLHGFYLSPASFKTTQELYPVFSQSKVGGFNDILYPSAWNYMDKVRYAPNEEFPDVPWEGKSNILFWRGATSEGVSQGWGQWQGMARQRFVHLANDPSASQPVLLPVHSSTSADSNEDKHRAMSYQPIPLTSLSTSFSIQHTSPIVRCGGIDCEAQAVHLAPLATETIDFQQHWRYKYLLDLDGAGFSGRFLPFLHSGSLVMKAGLFREWWEDRLKAWVHFVPLDIRAHGVGATVAYFGGVSQGAISGDATKGAGKNRGARWIAKDKEAKKIAEQGKEWAGKVLRKEDMEIYLFRLLLEWGRLTDDNRDKLGFEVAE